jgi:hypothetical protein
MGKTREVTLYSQVVSITTSYLGPAAERFIARQIQTHLNKQPDELTKQDLAKLVDWIKIAIALLTEDGKVVEEYSASLMALSKGTSR